MSFLAEVHGTDFYSLDHYAARPWLRVATALAKLQTAEWAVPAASCAIEIIGGAGYVEDHVCARLLRDAQVLPVWEGGANIQALEVLRLVVGDGLGFRAWEKRVETILASLQGPLAEVATPLADALTECRAAVVELGARPADGPRRAGRLATVMAETLAAVVLLEAAADSLSRGDARKALVARRFLEDCTSRPWATTADDEVYDRWFEPLLTGESIDASSVIAASRQSLR